MMSATCYRCGKVVFESESHVANGTHWHRRCWDEAVAEARATVGVMTTEPRPVVPGQEELRERIACAIAPQLDEMCFETPDCVMTPDDYVLAPIVDAILDTIEAAGLSIVATDRLNRQVVTDYIETTISDISEDWWCAGWLNHIEDEVWDAIEAGRNGDARLTVLADLRDRYDVWFCGYEQPCTATDYRAKRFGGEPLAGGDR